jgi:hypothetical protein
VIQKTLMRWPEPRENTHDARGLLDFPVKPGNDGKLSDAIPPFAQLC